MNQPNRPPDNTPWHYALNTKFLVVGGEVGCLTLFIVLIAVFGGLWIDGLLGTKPVITIILVLASAPFSLVLTVWVAKRAVKDISSSPSPGRKVNSIIDEEGGDDW